MPFLRRTLPFLLLLLPLASAAQHLPAYRLPQRLYEQGRELFRQAKYEAAQAAFTNYQQQTERYQNKPVQDLRRTSAELYAAKCAYHLLKLDAEARFQTFLKDHPGHAGATEARYYLAKLHFIKRKFDKAAPHLKTLDRSLLAGERRNDADLMLGFVHYQEGDYGRAGQLLAPLTASMGPQHDQASYYLGLVRYREGQLEEALKLFKGIRSSPDYALKVPVYISAILLEQQQYDRLETYGRGLLADDRDYAQKGKIYEQIGTALHALGRNEEALDFLEKGMAATATPSRGLRYTLGRTYHALGRDAKARGQLERVAEGEDTLAQAASYHLGFLYTEAGQLQDAKFAFKRAHELALKPDFTRDALFEYGKAAFEAEDYTESVRALKAYLAAYPDAGNLDEIRGVLAEALYYTSNFRSALRFFEEAGQLSARMKRAYQKVCISFGLRQLEAGRPDSAEHLFTRALGLDAEPVLTQNAHFWLGELHFRRGDNMAAAKHYNGHLTISGAEDHPLYAEARMGLGWAHFRQGNRQTARKHFAALAQRRSLRKTKPEVYEEAQLRLADLRFLAKSYQAAEDTYQRVLALNGKKQAYALYQSGLTNTRLEHYQTALSRYKKLISVYKKHPLRDDALLNVATVQLTWLKEYDKAAAFAKQLTEQHPNSKLVPQAYVTLGLAAQNNENQEQAVAHFTTVVEEYPRSEASGKAIDLICALVPADRCSEILQAYRQKRPETNERLEAVSFNAGRELFYQENYAKAHQQLSTYLNDYPGGANYHQALLLRGQAARELGRGQDALDDFRKVYEAQSAGEYIGPALLEAAQLTEVRGDTTRALALYERAAKQAASVSDGMQARFAWGRLLESLGRDDKARGLYWALWRDKNTTDYSRGRAGARLIGTLYELNRLDTAMAVIDSVEDHFNNAFAARAQYWRVRILHEQGDIEASAEAVYAMKRRYAAYSEWLGKAFLVMVENYVAQGKRLNAIETLKSLINNAPNDALRQRAESRLTELQAEVKADEPDEAAQDDDTDASELIQEVDPGQDDPPVREEAPDTAAPAPVPAQPDSLPKR